MFVENHHCFRMTPFSHSLCNFQSRNCYLSSRNYCSEVIFLSFRFHNSRLPVLSQHACFFHRTFIVTLSCAPLSDSLTKVSIDYFSVERWNSLLNFLNLYFKNVNLNRVRKYFPDHNVIYIFWIMNFLFLFLFVWLFCLFVSFLKAQTFRVTY